jgi:PAS domain S-box-containing protein
MSIKFTAVEDRFRALIEHCADGIVALAADGTFRYASASIVQVSGYTAMELIGQSAFGLVHPDDRDHALARFRETMAECGRVVRAEFRMRQRNGTVRWVEVVATNLLRNPAVQAVLATYRDVTERKQTETELRRCHEDLESRVAERTSELEAVNRALRAEIADRQQVEAALAGSRAQLAAVIESAMDAIVSIDAEHRIVLFNHAAELMFRRSAAATIGEPIDVLLPAGFRRIHRQYVESFAAEPRSARRCMAGTYVTGVRADGEEFPAESAISKAELGGKTLYTAILRDVSERLRAEEQLRASSEMLRALAARYESVREEERSRIAREVHDELGQALTGLKIDLSTLARDVRNRLPDAEQRVDAMTRLVGETIDFVRELSAQLRPPVLDDVGLAAAIEWQAQEFQSRTGVVCRLVSSLPDEELPTDVSTALFRILQEALTNVARHAGATFVHIRLDKADSVIILTVTDNGRGITPEEIENVRSLGLVGMRERSLLLGGNVTITGQPGNGTTVTARIPVVYDSRSPGDVDPAGVAR